MEEIDQIKILRKRLNEFDNDLMEISDLLAAETELIEEEIERLRSDRNTE